VLLLNECLLLLISLSTQSGNFWIHSRIQRPWLIWHWNVQPNGTSSSIPIRCVRVSVHHRLENSKWVDSICFVRCSVRRPLVELTVCAEITHTRYLSSIDVLDVGVRGRKRSPTGYFITHIENSDSERVAVSKLWFANLLGVRYMFSGVLREKKIRDGEFMCKHHFNSHTNWSLFSIYLLTEVVFCALFHLHSATICS
jgi:hypothetical protein